MISLDATHHLWNARLDPRRKGPAIGTYPHVLDQWAIFYDQPIVLGKRQAGAAIEGALRQTLVDNLERVAVDTHGFTHVAMALGKNLRPRYACNALFLHIILSVTFGTNLTERLGESDSLENNMRWISMDDLALRADRGGVCRLTLNRPDKLNALNVDLFKALEAHVAHLERAAVGVVVLRGAGRRFRDPLAHAQASSSSTG
jgi:hypothetical protein